MKKRSKLRDWLVCAFVRIIFGLIGRLPDAAGYGVSVWLFRAADRLVPKLRRVALRNLELAEPALDAPSREKRVDQVFRSIARLAWVVARLSCVTFDTVSKYLRIENLDFVTAAMQRNRGLLFATAHLGAWELSALAFGKLVQPMDVVARPLDNPYLEAWLLRLRTQTGNRIFSKSGALRDILRALDEQRAVGFLLDHNVISSDLCFVNFFGIETSASTVFAKIAARSGAPVVPGFALWDEQERRFVLRFYPPVPITGDAQTDTQAIHSVIEGVIRQAPDQWLWVHRRFKTRPPGEAPLYQ